jgi:hypothetical protein
MKSKKEWVITSDDPFFSLVKICLLYLFNDGLESLGVVEGEVGEHLTVNLDTSL